MSEVSEGKKPELLAPGSNGARKNGPREGDTRWEMERLPERPMHENSFYSLFECAENSYWLTDSRGDKFSRWAKKFPSHVFLAHPVLSCTYFFHLFLYVTNVSMFYEVER